jgi:hypothetical protein
MEIMNLCSVVMVTSTTEDNSHENDGLIYAGEYLDIARIPKTNYTKNLVGVTIVIVLSQIQVSKEMNIVLISAVAIVILLSGKHHILYTPDSEHFHIVSSRIRRYPSEKEEWKYGLL